MVRHLLIILSVATAQLAILTSCSNSVELDMQQITTAPTPFIECYCEVGELYNLAATYLSPIDEPQNLDYSYDFEVYITDTEEHRLLQSIFYVDSFIYSHGSSASLPVDFDGELQLRVVTEDGAIYTATSTVPDPVEIAVATLDQNCAVVEFDSSADPSQNYYSLTTSIRTAEGETIRIRTTLYNPEPNERLLYQREVEYMEGGSVEILLLRLNFEGYRYLYTIVENDQTLDSNLMSGVPLKGNIEGAVGVFTAYTSEQITLDM